MTDKQKHFLNGNIRIKDLEKIIKQYGNKTLTAMTSGETPLHIAARFNNFHLLKAMLPYYTNLEATDNIGNTILHILADHNVEECVSTRKKRIESIRSIISKGADINKQNNNGWTPVHFAAKHCLIEMLKFLKKNSADFNLRTIANETTLLLACKYMNENRSNSRETQTINFLINRVPDINIIDTHGYSVLHYAAEKCSSKTIIKLLKHGADLHLRTKEHKLTPLHLATMKKNNLSIVKILLKAGAIIESPDIDELTPLQTSLLGGSSDVVIYLIKNGANVNYSEKNLQFTPLHIVIYQQNSELFQLLIDNGADVNYSAKDGMTPLHLSSMLGCSKFVELIISLGAKVNCLYNDNLTPLHLCSLMCHITQDIDDLCGPRALKYGKEKSMIAKLLTYPYDKINQNYDTVLKILLRNGADVNALTTNGGSSLLFATKTIWHTHKFVKILLENGANVNCKEPNFGFTALHFASSNNLETTVEDLIKAGADVNALSIDGKLPIHLALKPNCAGTLKMLVKHGAFVNVREIHSQLTLLQIALDKNYKTAALILINAGGDVNTLTPNGKSPIHLALESNSTDLLKPLIFHGADVNYKEPNSKLTPLHIALIKMNLDAALILIDAGAEVNSLTPDKKSPLNLALEAVYLQYLSRILTNVLKLLIDNGADVNYVAPNSNSTPLLIAINAGHSEAAAILIKANANIHVFTRTGEMPIHLASTSNDTMILKLLIKYGANVNHRENYLQLTPLHLALYKNHDESVEILIRGGADVNALTPDAKSPLHLALEFNCKSVLKSLITRGAKLNCEGRRCLYSLMYILSQSSDSDDVFPRIEDVDSRLLLVINSEEKKEIKIAMFRLIALVDVRNEKSCMIKNSDVNECINKIHECLRDCEVDTHDFEAYNNFITYRIFNGAFHEFRDIEVSCNNIYVSNYLFMLNAIELFPTNNYVINEIPYGYEERCVEEVKKLKEYSICDGVTLYDVVRMKPRRRRCYTRNLNLSQIDCVFEIYCKLILAYYYEDRLKNKLMEIVQLSLSLLTNVFLPIILIEDIFFNLSIIDIIATIEAVEEIDDI